jgi:hypothetical protein
MEENRKYTETLIAVLEFAISNKKLSSVDGERIAGDYWGLVKRELNNSGVICLEYGNEVTLLTTEKVRTKLSEAKIKLENIEGREYDRNLDNKSKKDSAKLAKWSIVISILAATGLPQKVLQWLFELIKESFANI